MVSEESMKFMKQKIKDQLFKIKDQMGKYRYRLYLAVVDDCDDFEVLREMAELDLQMQNFEHINSEIKPMLNDMNVPEVRRIDEGDTKDIGNHLDNFNISPSSIAEAMEDKEINQAMEVLMGNAANIEPDEEKYRESLIEYQFNEQPLVESLDHIEEDPEDAKLLSGYLGTYTDTVDEPDDTEEECEEDEYDLSDLDDFFSDEDFEENADNKCSDKDEKDPENSKFFDDMPKGKEVEEGLMTKHEIFVDGSDEKSKVSKKDKMTEDDIFLDDEFDFEVEEEDESDYITGEIIEDDSEDSDESDEYDLYDSDDYFLDEDDDVVHTDDKIAGSSEDDDDKDEEDDDPFSNVEDDFDYYYSEEDEESEYDKNNNLVSVPKNDITEDESVGLIDDTSDYFLGDDIEKDSGLNDSGDNLIHEVSSRNCGIRPDNVFLDGTERGKKTQEMFSMFIKVGNKLFKGCKKEFNQLKKLTENNEDSDLGF